MGKVPSKPIGEVPPDQADQLGRFIELLYEKVKVDYSDPAVQEQRDFVQKIVNKIANRIGKICPIFKVTRIVKAGSFYKRIKLLQANEFDFILLLAIAYDKSKIKVVNDSDGDDINWGQVIIVDPNLKEQLNEVWAKACNETPSIVRGYNDDVSRITFKKLITDNGKLSNNVKFLFVYLVHKCLLELDGQSGLKYLGYKSISSEESETNPITVTKNEIMLDRKPSGPSIGLRLGGPMCMTDIDLNFCMEESSTPKGRHILTPYIHDELFWGIHYCGNPCYHWTLSLCDYPKGSRIKLDEPHRKIVVFLKYIRSKKFSGGYKPTNSHVLTTLVERQQEQCSQSNLGNCLVDIMRHYWRYYYDFDSGIDTYEGLWDIDFPDVVLLSPVLRLYEEPISFQREFEEIGCLLECVRTEPDWEEKLKINSHDLKQFEVEWDKLVKEFRDTCLK